MSFPVCKFFRSEQGCKFGNKCRYKHSETPPFPEIDHSDYQGHHNGSVSRRPYSEESSSYSQEHFSSTGKHEAAVRNPRFQPADNFPVHPRFNRAEDHYEDQLRNRSGTSKLEEKFQGLDTTDQDGSEQQQRPQRKVCQFFARNGYCSFGSRCRFDHAQVNPAAPPRFQQGRGRGGQGPRFNHGQSRPSGDQLGRDDRLRSNQYPSEGRGYGPPKSASAGTSDSRGQAQGQRREGQPQRAEGRESRFEEQERKPVTFPGSRADKICQFYVSGWCVRGRRCRFLHPRRGAEPAREALPAETQPENQDEKPPSSQRPEENDGSDPGQDASAGNNCEQTSKQPTEKKSTTIPAPKPRPPYIPQGVKKYRRDEVDDVEASRLRRTEIEQLLKRFPKNKVKVNRDCAEFFQCVVSFSPTDPDWPFDVKVFQLQVDIPSDYPFEMMTITLPEDQDLPETVRRYLEVSIEEWLSDREAQLGDSGQLELVFRPFLRWLDRNIEDVVTEALKQLKRELVAKAAGLQFISAKELQKQYPGPSTSHDEDNEDEGSEEEDDEDDDDDETESEDDEDTSSSYDAEEEEDEDDDNNDDEEKNAGEEDQESKRKKDKKTQQADKVKAMMVDPERKGTEISLKNLQLKESTATLYFEKLCLMINCERCKHTSEFVATPGRLNMVQCPQCSQTQSAIYRPAMAHHFSSIMGYLDLDACLPFDVVLQNSSPVFACMNCSKDTKTGVVIAGKPQDHWCRVCHQKLRVATDGVRFTQLQASKPPQSLKGPVKVVVPSRKRLPKDPAIQEGKPLPGFGTCKHYKKSYRWLRFPCCGKAYPCDVCHDSKEDHEMTYANRMICGFCCKEQPFAMDRPCKGCDMNMTRVRTVHWEGGQGCRDKISMSRNDKQKYKNSNKTVSKHSQKVKDMQSKKKTKLRHT